MSVNLSSIPSSQQSIFQDVIDKLLNEHNVDAVIGFGSYFEDGGKNFNTKNMVGSDIDLIALSENIQNKIMYLNRGYRFEIRHFDLFRFRIMLNRFHLGFVPQMAKGSILYDSKNIALDIQKLAQSIYTKGNPSFKNEKLMNKSRASFISMLYTLESNTDDLPKFQVCFNEAVRKLYSIECIKANVWENSVKNMFRHSREFDIEFFKVLEACYRSNDPHFKIQTLKKRAEKTLESQGGLDFTCDLIL